MSTAKINASGHRPVMRDVRVVVDRGREERLRAEREVEDPSWYASTSPTASSA